MSTSAYLVGALVLAVELVAALLAGGAVARAGFPGARRSTVAVAAGVVATAILVGAHVLVLALGVLSRVTAPVAVLALAALAWRLWGREPAGPREDGEDAPAAATLLSWAIAAGVGAVVVVVGLGLLVRASRHPPTGYDAAAFHLPGVARWIQSGSLWQLDWFVPYQASGAYPSHGDVVQLVAALPFHAVFLARFAMAPFVALMALAIYAGARELGAPRPPAVLCAAAVAGVAAVLASAIHQSLVDAVMLATFGAGVLFLLRHRRTRRRADLVLAGLALGIAFGTKWYGVAYVPIIVGLWTLERGLAGEWRRALRDAAAVGGLVLLAGGIWLLRNWIEAANPVFPQRVPVLGFDAPSFDPQRAATGFSIVHYLGDWTALRQHILPDIRMQIGGVGPLLVAGALAAVAMGRRDPRARALALVAACAAAIAVAYPFLPFTALGPEGMPSLTESNVRYVVPALVVAAMAAAWAIGRAGRWAPALELVLAAAALLALRHQWPGFGHSALGAVVAVVVAAAVGALALLRRRAPAVALAAAVVAAVAAGLVLERRAPLGYGRASPVFATIDAAGEGTHVGIAGSPALDLPPFLPAFGPRLANDVEYVGPIREHWLTRYGAPEPFQRALREGDFDFLIVWSGTPRPAPELAWAKAAGFEEVAATATKTLLQPG
jgi:hypothetical protein